MFNFKNQRFMKKMIYRNWAYALLMDENANFDFEKNFFELSYYQIERLGTWAKMFHIHPKNGKSPARHLYDCAKDNLPI